jgi:hypothetical protein
MESLFNIEELDLFQTTILVLLALLVIFWIIFLIVYLLNTKEIIQDDEIIVKEKLLKSYFPEADINRMGGDICPICGSSYKSAALKYTKPKKSK